MAGSVCLWAVNVPSSLNSGPSCDRIDEETELSRFPLAASSFISSFEMSFAEELTSLVIVFGSWGQRLKFAENSAFLL